MELQNVIEYYQKAKQDVLDLSLFEKDKIEIAQFKNVVISKEGLKEIDELQTQLNAIQNSYYDGASARINLVYESFRDEQKQLDARTSQQCQSDQDQMQKSVQEKIVQHKNKSLEQFENAKQECFDQSKSLEERNQLIEHFNAVVLPQYNNDDYASRQTDELNKQLGLIVEKANQQHELVFNLIEQRRLQTNEKLGQLTSSLNAMIQQINQENSQLHQWQFECKRAMMNNMISNIQKQHDVDHFANILKSAKTKEQRLMALKLVNQCRSSQIQYYQTSLAEQRDRFLNTIAQLAEVGLKTRYFRVND